MIITFGQTNELQQIVDFLNLMESQLTALQTAVATLQTDVTALGRAVTAFQASAATNQFTAQDVAAVQAIDTNVKALTAALTPVTPPAPPSS